MNGCTGKASNDEDVKATIIALEKQALELWNNGNPDGFLELSSDDVIYFDPFFEYKLEGKKSLEDYYNKIRGQFKVESYKMIRPVVQSISEVSILTYNLTSQSGNETYKWNCTEVYKLNSHSQWEIIHTHWSFVQPDK